MSLRTLFFGNTKPQLQYRLQVRGNVIYVLPNSPTGWEGSLITVSRSPTYYGMLRTFTVPMDFVLDGAWILRTEFYQKGIQGDITFFIDELDENNQYVNIYEGAIDFSKIKDTGSLDGYTFTVNVMQNDMAGLVAAYEDTPFEIPLNVPAAILINMPGIALNEMALMGISSSSDFRCNAFFAITVDSNQINSINTSVKQAGFVAQTTPDFTTTGEWFFRARTNTKVDLIATVGGTVDPPGGGGAYEINIYNNTGALVRTIYSYPFGTATKDFQVTVAFSTTLAESETLILYMKRTDNSSDTNSGFRIANGSISLSYSTISPPTTVRALPAYYVYDYLLQRIWQLQFNGTTTLAQSFLLSNTWKQIYLSSGDAFRPTNVEFTYFDPGNPLVTGDYYTVIAGPFGIPTSTVLYNTRTYNIGDQFIAVATQPTFSSSNGGIVESGNNPAVIKTSFKDFFKWANMTFNASFVVQNGISILETKGYSFNDALLAADVGNVSKFALEIYTAYIANSIHIGYPDQTYDVINGKNEVNSQQTYSTPISRMQSPLDLTTKYRADPYGMEFLRIQEGQGNVTKGDNDVFVIKCTSTPVSGQVYYEPEWLRQDGTVPGLYSNVTGVDVGYFNLDLTPHKCLLRHSNYLAGMLFQIAGQIKLSAALKNTDVITVDLLGNKVIENAPIDISTLGTPLFIPYQATIGVKLPNNVLQMITNFPTGRIDFVVDGNQYHGFITSVDVDVARNSDRQYKVLLTSQNNLLNLIH